MQKKTFTAWVNSHLKREGMEVEDLSKDFGDGVKLIKLIETISEETLGKYHKNPVRSWLRAAAPVPMIDYHCSYVKSKARAKKLS